MLLSTVLMEVEALSDSSPTVADAENWLALGSSGERGVHVRESIRLECPIDDVYRYWRLPQFMVQLDRVTPHRLPTHTCRLTNSTYGEIITILENREEEYRQEQPRDGQRTGAARYLGRWRYRRREGRRNAGCRVGVPLQSE